MSNKSATTPRLAPAQWERLKNLRPGFGTFIHISTYSVPNPKGPMFPNLVVGRTYRKENRDV